MSESKPPYGIQRLHHFTDERNLKSILAHGLLSRKESLLRGIDVFPGGSERSQRLDIAYGLDGYVHLSLTPHHPMQYVALDEGRIIQAIDIAVSVEVLDRPGVMTALYFRR